MNDNNREIPPNATIRQEYIRSAVLHDSLLDFSVCKQQTIS